MIGFCSATGGADSDAVPEEEEGNEEGKEAGKGGGKTYRQNFAHISI